MSLIVLEGLDGSGKGTQTALLFEALIKQGYSVRKISFPDYREPSSALVRMYLDGAFGEDPAQVSPYAASAFYAVDRFASYQRFWKDAYQAGEVILADRYTTSNMIYQAEKLPEESRNAFYRWLSDLEFDKFQLPKPDAVFYLDMLPEISQQLLLKRYGGDSQKKDIHEKDSQYLAACRMCAAGAAKACGWTVIPCFDGDVPLPIEEVHQMILKKTLEVLNPIC